MRLGRLILALLILLVASVVALGALSWHGSIAPGTPPAPASFAQPSIAKGAQLAAIGNCETCHTQPGGRRFAGGVAIPTPYGTLYSSNITPDAATGIGAWSLPAFARAMRRGISRDGHHLYPAFPYPHFAGLDDQQIADLYAYLMTRPAAANRPADPVMQFPFNMRALMAVWNVLYGNAAAPPTASRGEQLAEGLAHCAACHSPRNELGAERTDAAYQGAEIDGWHAPALENATNPAPLPWSEEELATYLVGGLAQHHGASAGPMQAVTNNLAHADPADVRAIAAYIAGLGGPLPPSRMRRAEEVNAVLTDSAIPPIPPAGPGADIYAGACAVCHQDGWRSTSINLAPLALSSALSDDSPRDAIRVILAGRRARESEPGPQMPPFANVLNNDQLIAVLTHLRVGMMKQQPWPDLAATVTAIRREQGLR